MPFQIQKAVRRGVPPLIGLWGPSGSGKTYTALHMARGIVGPTGKIGMIDTENGRALFYSEEAGGWDHLDLQPPFTPARYTEAFDAFEAAGGYGCVIVDSMSHVWEGEGGVLDMADNGKSREGRPLQGLKKWQAPKMEHKRMMNSLLRAPFAAIFCLRAKEGVKQVGGGQNAEIQSVGAQPISDKGLIFEMTISALLGPDHCPVFPGPDELLHCNPLIPALKAPEGLRGIFQEGRPLGIETGKKIADWSAGVVPFDADLTKLQRNARNAAMQGTQAFNAGWEQTPDNLRAKLAPIYDELVQIAQDADREAAQYDSYEDQTAGLDL